nr:hybrid signal transduction histidine kinase M [Tanacetum cinerariifolium]
MLTTEEILAKFIDEGKREHEENHQRDFIKRMKQLTELEEDCTKTMNERCSTVLLNILPLKEKDPKNFTIPCQVLDKQKEAEDLAIDHLSRFENPHMEVLTAREIADKFSDEHLMVQKCKFNNDEPWRCVTGSETLKILAHCHLGPTGGHHGASVTTKKPLALAKLPCALDFDLPKSILKPQVGLGQKKSLAMVNLGLKNHIEDPSTSTSTIVPEWSKIDDLIKMWILGTLSESLQDEVVTTPGTAKDL